MSIQRIYCVPKRGLCTKPGICDRRLCHLPPEQTYHPDLGITRARYRYSLNPVAWVVIVFCILMFVIKAATR